MLYDGVQIIEGSKIVNLTADSGSSFPTNANLGEMFFRTDENQLYIYSSSGWGLSSSVSSGGTVDTTAIAAAAKSYADSADAIVLAAAKTYSDSSDTAKLSEAKSYTDSVGTVKLADAKSYTDAASALLQSQVNDIISNTDATALNSLSEIVAAFQSADSSLNGAITTLASNQNSALTQEVANRDSAVSTASAQTLASANAYTDSQVFASSAALSISAMNDAKTYADSADSIVLSSAKTYADSLATSLNASNLTTGTVPSVRLGTGIASSSTYLRGDSTWVAERLDLGMSYIGKAPAGTVALFAANKAFTLPVSLTNSSARAITAATAATTFTLFKRVGSTSTNIGTAQFAAGASTATFTFTAAVSFAVGDMLIISLNATDTTLADVAFTLTGTFA